MSDENKDETQPIRANVRALTLADVLMQCANALNAATQAMMVTLQYAQEQNLFNVADERQRRALDEIDRRARRATFMQDKKVPNAE